MTISFMTVTDIVDPVELVKEYNKYRNVWFRNGSTIKVDETSCWTTRAECRETCIHAAADLEFTTDFKHLWVGNGINGYSDHRADARFSDVLERFNEIVFSIAKTQGIKGYENAKVHMVREGYNDLVVYGPIDYENIPNKLPVLNAIQALTKGLSYTIYVYVSRRWDVSRAIDMVKENPKDTMAEEDLQMALVRLRRYIKKHHKNKALLSKSVTELLTESDFHYSMLNDSAMIGAMDWLMNNPLPEEELTRAKGDPYTTGNGIIQYMRSKRISFQTRRAPAVKDQVPALTLAA